MRKSSLAIIAASMIHFAPVVAFDPFQVEDIKIEGLQRISEGTVLNYLPVTIGDDLEESQTSEIIRALFKTGFFQDVELVKDGDTLVIKVVERPSIGSIEVTGNKEIKTEALLETLKDQGMAEGYTFDRSTLELLRNELEKMYFSHGKYAVKIDTRVTELPRNRVKIEINIDEGFIARIREINIIGNHAFTDKELKSQFNLTTPNYKSWVTRSDQYDKQNLSKDLESLRTYYFDRGYLNFEILSTQVSITPDKQDIFITITIDEGMPFTLNSYSVVGNTVLPDEELERFITLETGAVFSRSKVSDIVKNLTERLGHEGYAFAKVNPVPELNEQTKEVDLTFYVEPGNKVYVRRIEFKGNTKTKDDVMRLHMSQIEGDTASTALIENSKIRLDRTGFFKEVKVDTQPVPGVADQVDVIFTVEETSSGELSGGVGYSDVDKLVFNANVSNRNFLGTGKSVDLNFNKSKAYTTYSFGYNNPFYTMDGISLGFNLFYSKTDLGETTRISKYVTDAYGANLNYGVPIDQYNRINFGFGYQNTDLKTNKDENTLPEEIKRYLDQVGQRRTDEFTFAFGWSYNSFDRYLFPTKGVSQGLGVNWALPGSDLEYYRLTYNFQGYKPISHGFIGMVNAVLGYGDSYGKTDSLPFYKNFFAGGSRSVRGYEESSLGPLDTTGNRIGGNFVATGTLALVLPNFIAPETNAIRTAVFVDGGQVYDLKNKDSFINPAVSRNPTGIRYSAGVSLTWMSPMAPLVFSYAIPLNPDYVTVNDKRQYRDEIKKFSFTFGTVF